MDYIISKITDYVLVINPSIDRNDFLNYVVSEVVDRALVYMNRVQLVKQYEEDILEPDFDVNDYDEELRPIPKPLWRPLASTVINVYKYVLNQQRNAETDEAPQQGFKRLRDQVQEVEYTEAIASYLATVSDTELFMGTTVLLDRYIIGTVIKNDNTGICKTENFTSIL